MYLKVYNHSCSTALQLSAMLDTQQNGWNTAGSLKAHLASKNVFIKISIILRQKTMYIFKSCLHRQLNSGLSVTIIIQSSLLFHLTIFLALGDFFLKIELLLLPQ